MQLPVGLISSNPVVATDGAATATAPVEVLATPLSWAEEVEAAPAEESSGSRPEWAAMATPPRDTGECKLEGS